MVVWINSKNLNESRFGVEFLKVSEDFLYFYPILLGMLKNYDLHFLLFDLFLLVVTFSLIFGFNGVCR